MKITIEAGAGEGKTTVAILIHKALTDAGFKVELDDADVSMSGGLNTTFALDDDFKNRISALHKKRKNEIILSTVQSKRERKKD